VLAALEPGPADRWSLVREAPLPTEDDTLGVVHWLHSPGLVERVRKAAGSPPGFVDGQDCVVSVRSAEAILAAAGLAVQAALDLVNRRLHRAFIALRPPSHHAEADRARGYCFVNNVALAAELITRALSCPVLIADLDAHHGNGTQGFFLDRADVAYLSAHQYPGFPGTGAGDEIGEGKGRGTTRNIPLAAGADDDVFATAFEDGLEELGSRVRPAVILVSAGFDAHAEDPLSEMSLTESGFRRMTRAIVQASATWSGGRVISFLEGGFAPDALARSVRAHVEELLTGPAISSAGEPPASS
jgi:acetoin utilization deacetylase AcuC-like enzyme